jgi:hypothetical protein
MRDWDIAYCVFPLQYAIGCFIMWRERVFSRENMLAVALCVIVILLIIVTSGSAPEWIYQGF